MQEFKKAQPEVRSPEKSGGEESFGLVRCLVGVDRTGEGRLTGGGDVVTGSGGRACHQLSELLYLGC